MVELIFGGAGCYDYELLGDTDSVFRSKIALLIAVLHKAKLAGSIPAASLKFRRDIGEKRNGSNPKGKHIALKSNIARGLY